MKVSSKNGKLIKILDRIGLSDFSTTLDTMTKIENNIQSSKREILIELKRLSNQNSLVLMGY
jgi:hypothetical protein